MSDPLRLQEWPEFVWKRSFTYNMPFSHDIHVDKGGTIVYLAQTCYRTDTNLALLRAAWLSMELNIPLVVVTLLENEVVQSVLSQPPVTPVSLTKYKLMKSNEWRLRSLCAMSRALAEHDVPLVAASYKKQLNNIDCLSSLFNSHVIGTSNDRFSGVFALFTDDFSNPVHRKLCAKFVSKYNVPCMALESNRVICHSSSIHLAEGDVLSSATVKSAFLEELQQLAKSSWSADVDLTALRTVQRNLQYQRVGDRYLPSVLATDIIDSEEVTIVPLDQLCRSLNEMHLGISIPSSDSTLTGACDSSVLDEHISALCAQDDRFRRFCDSSVVAQRFDEMMRTAVQAIANNVTANRMSRAEEDFLLVALEGGLLSLQCLAAWATSTARSCIDCLIDHCIDGELANLILVDQLLQREDNVVTITAAPNPSVTVDWFASLDDTIVSQLLEDGGVLSNARRKVNSSSFTPKALRTSSTNMWAFDRLQNLWQGVTCTDAIIYYPRRVEYQFYVLTMLLHVPESEMALRIVLQEVATYSPLPIDIFTGTVARFLQAVRDIAQLLEQCRREDVDLLIKFEEMKSQVEVFLNEF